MDYDRLPSEDRPVHSPLLRLLRAYAAPGACSRRRDGPGQRARHAPPSAPLSTTLPDSTARIKNANVRLVLSVSIKIGEKSRRNKRIVRRGSRKKAGRRGPHHACPCPARAPSRRRATPQILTPRSRSLLHPCEQCLLLPYFFPVPPPQLRNSLLADTWVPPVGGPATSDMNDQSTLCTELPPRMRTATNGGSNNC